MLDPLLAPEIAKEFKQYVELHGELKGIAGPTKMERDIITRHALNKLL